METKESGVVRRGRAAKVGSKLYWYGSGGEILSETDAAGNTLNEYVFFSGKRVALVVSAMVGALYYAEDLLGSSAGGPAFRSHTHKAGPPS